MLKLRGKTWQLYKRVPKRYADVEPRTFVWVSLHTDSKTAAAAKADAAWALLIEGWEARLAGASRDAEAHFDAARRLAAARSFRYIPVSEVAKLPVEDLLARVEAITERKGVPDAQEAVALLGGAKVPAITVSRALELYWDLAADKVIGMNADQQRRWRNPIKKAVQNFIEVVGDKSVATISGDDMLDFRQWWIDRIDDEGLTANSANKDLIHFGKVLKTVNRMKRLNLVLPLTDLSLAEGDKSHRPPFSVPWIRDKLLAPGALDGLNLEARCLLLGMVNTGYRPSEAVGLLPAHIRLDAEVPHISIEPVERRLKSSYARRVIPLTGVSLEAFRQCPEVFPRYRGKATFSATVNKYLRENGLVESGKHTLYSLRHSFEDRMLAAGIDERIRRDLFGHTLNRERYGAGATLEMKRDVLQAIAL